MFNCNLHFKLRFPLRNALLALDATYLILPATAGIFVGIAGQQGEQ